MKKINANQELDKIQNKKKSINIFIPMLFLGCFFWYIGFTFSGNIVDDGFEYYNIYLEIQNGKESIYIKNVPSGKFSDVIDVEKEFDSLECSKGTLLFDVDSKTIYSDNIISDVKCVLNFKEDEFDPMEDVVVNQEEAIIQGNE